MTKSTQVLYDYDETLYHARTEMSKSKSDTFAHSPLKFWDYYLSPTPYSYKQTEAFLIGSAVHTLVLEPEKFDELYVQAPNINRRTKVGKEEWIAFQEENVGKDVLDANSMIQVMRMGDALMQHKEAASYLKNLKSPEVTIITELHGVPFKCRLDGITSDGCAVDLKTTREGSEDGFNKSFLNYRYHFQAYIYSLAFKQAFGEFPKAFPFICVEKTRPYNVSVYYPDDKWYEMAKFGYTAGKDVVKGFKELLNQYKLCVANNHWPDYNEGQGVVLEPPKYVQINGEEK